MLAWRFITYLARSAELYENLTNTCRPVNLDKMADETTYNLTIKHEQ